VIEPFEANGKTGLRLYVGPFDTFGAADDLCSRLTIEGGECLVVDRRDDPRSAAAS
jgi:hypothetical protein